MCLTRHAHLFRNLIIGERTSAARTHKYALLTVVDALHLVFARGKENVDRRQQHADAHHHQLESWLLRKEWHIRHGDNHHRNQYLHQPTVALRRLATLTLFLELVAPFRKPSELIGVVLRVVLQSSTTW